MTASTNRSRAALPASVYRADATFNVARVAMLVAAFERGDVDLLRVAMEDRLHQAVRLGALPGSAEALAAGARGRGLGRMALGFRPDGRVSCAPRRTRSGWRTVCRQRQVRTVATTRSVCARSIRPANPGGRRGQVGRRRRRRRRRSVAVGNRQSPERRDFEVRAVCLENRARHSASSMALAGDRPVGSRSVPVRRRVAPSGEPATRDVDEAGRGR